MRIEVEKSGRKGAVTENTERLRELLPQGTDADAIYEKAASPARGKPNVGFGRIAKAAAKRIEKKQESR